MDKQLFDDAIGEVPPSTVDVDGAITRGRRAARLRHVANPVVAAGVAVVLLTGLVAYTMTRDDKTGGVTIGAPPTTSSATSTPSALPTTTTTTGVTLPPPGPGDTNPTPQPPEACDRPNLETVAQLNDRLTQVATAAFHAQRPDVTLEVNTANSAMPNKGPLGFYQVNGSKVDTNEPICHEDSYFMAMATTRGPEGTGNVTVIIQPSPYKGSSLNCDAISPEETSCDIV